ncbi:MAG: ATP-binding protein [Halioglobus sp.]
MNSDSSSLQALVDSLQNDLDAAHNRIAHLEHSLQLQHSADTASRLHSNRSVPPREAFLEETEKIAHVGHEIWDHVSDKTIHVSEELARIYGFSVNEYMQAVKSMDDYFHLIVPEDREAYEAYEDLFAKEQSYTPLSIEYRIKRADGEIRHLHQNSKLIPAEAGPPTQSISVIQDITRYKQVEAELQQSRDDLLETAEIISLSADIANLGYSIWDYDEDKFLLVSDKWASNFGLTTDQFLKIAPDFEKYIELVHPDDRALYRAYYLSERDVPQLDYRIIHSSGETRHVVQHYMLLEQSGNERAIVTVQDVTDRKKAEAALVQSSKLITLGEMSAGVAHELNQPLNVIMLAAENVVLKLAHGNLDDAYLKDKLERIVAQTNRASTIVDHLRRFGRDAKEEFYEVDLREAALGALNLMGEQLRLAQIDVQTSLGGDFPSVMGHQIQLEQMFINLFSNAFYAIKESDPAEKSILIEAFKSSDGAATIRVTDTGGGIPEAVLPNIFDPFYTTKNIEDGTGLGLSVSYGFVRDMGGTITAANTGVGACFEIKIPPFNAGKVDH